jgi:hypothetical protein
MRAAGEADLLCPTSIPAQTAQPLAELAGQMQTRSRVSACLMAVCLLLLGQPSSLAQVACKPLLSVRSGADARMPALPAVASKWNTTIVADASFCATRSGTFEIDFIRIRDNSPDLQFTQSFRWDQNRFDVAIELTPGEAILAFRIGFVAPCPCRDIDRLSSPSPREMSQAR